MAIDIETLGISIDTSGLKDAWDWLKKTTKAGEETADSADKVGGRFKALESATSGLTRMLAGIGVTMLAKQFLQMADTVTLMDARLKLAVGSGADYAKAQADIYAIAQKNNMGLSETAELYTKLYEPVKLLGGGVRETSAITEAFALTMKVGGANAQSAASATLQFAQAMGKGSLSGDEFNSIAEASPRLLKALAEGMNVPIGKLKEMGSDGKLTADVVGNALVGSLEKLRAEGEQIPMTVGAALQSVFNDGLNLVGTFDKLTGASGNVAQMIVDYLTPALKGLYSVAVGVYQAFETVGKGIGGVFAAIGAALSGDFSGAKRILSEMSDDITAGWSKAGQSINDVWSKTGATAGVAANEVKKLGGAIGATDGEKKKAAAAAKKLNDEYESLLAKIYGKENGTDPDFIKNLRLIETQGLKAGKSMEVIRKEQEAYTKLQPFAVKEQEKLNKEYEDAVKALDDMLGAQEKNVDTLKKQVEQERFAVESMGLSKEAVVDLEIAKISETAAQKERLAALADDIDLSGETGKAYREQARLLRELADLKKQGAVKDSAITEAKKATDEWTKLADSVNESLTDALMRGFESGKDFAGNLRDTMVNMFKTLVLRPIISAVVSPVAGAITGALGLSGSSGGGGGMDILSSLGSIGSSVSSLGSLLGNTAMGALDIGGFSLGGLGSSLGGLGAAMPWIGGIMAVASLAKKFKSPGEQHTGGYYSSNGLEANMANALTVTGGGGDGAYARDLITRANPEIRTLVGTTVDSVIASTQAQAKALGMDISLGIDAGLAANTNGKGKNKNTFGYFNITSGGEVVEEYSNRELGADFGEATAQFAADMADAAARVVLAGTDFQRAGESASQTLQRLSAIQSVSESLNQLGGIFSSIAGSSVEARESMVNLAGGIDALVSQANQFVKDYYSADEQAGIAASAINNALANVGLTAGDLANKEDFRALVESLNPEDSVQREQLATLLQIAPNFSELSTYLKENNMTLEDAMANAPDVPILQAILDPSQVTAQATQEMVSQLGSIDSQLGGIATSVGAAVSAAESAAAAASAAAGAAGSAAGAAAAAAADVALSASQPGYNYEFGGA